ncbi:MAG: T9SS type A sorting domain-containing protein [Bacteroidia bacterium]
MRKLLVLLLFMLTAAGTNAQQIKQLTFNNTSDWSVSLYKNKVVWVNSGTGYSDIFLTENDTIKQITYGSNYNFWPDVGSKYIVWLRNYVDHWSGASKKSLIYYDGNSERELDTGSIIFPQTAGKYILWRKYTDVSVENYHEQYLFFDGENTRVIAESHKKNLISNFQFTESEIVYTVTDTFTKIARLISYDYSKKTVMDSVVNGLFLSSSYYYNLRKFEKPVYLYYYYSRSDTSTKTKYYINGKISELNIYDIVVDINEDFMTFLSFRGGKYNYDSCELTIWRNNKLFSVSKYPFTEIENHPELHDVSTFFYLQDTMGKYLLYVFQSEKITQLSSGYNFNYWYNSNISGKSIAWSTYPGKDYTQSEVYYYCGEDSCINAIPLKDFKAKIYYKAQAKKIAVEIETPQAEKFNLEVYDLLGRKVAGTNFISLYGTFTFLFPTESVIQGLYIVKLQNASNPEQHLTQKLFIPN